jgi:hypothetical protein
MSPLRSVRHEPAQARPRGQQYHRKHNRKRYETTTQCEEKTLRSVVTEFKERRDSASDRMKNGGNQHGDDKSSHSCADGNRDWWPCASTSLRRIG